MHRVLTVIIAAGVLVGCGGGGKSTSTQPVAPPPPNLGGGAVSKPVVVSVASGQAVSGINVTVVTPAASPQENAQVLGVGALTGSGEAFNTGATIPRGATQRVLLFGPGLSGTMQVTVGGPNDITVSNVTSIKATDGTPGISFTVTVGGNAALGCRTVYLQATNNDITTFTGGLEVVQ